MKKDLKYLKNLEEGTCIDVIFEYDNDICKKGEKISFKKTKDLFNDLAFYSEEYRTFIQYKIILKNQFKIYDEEKRKNYIKEKIKEKKSEVDFQYLDIDDISEIINNIKEEAKNMFYID